MQNKRGDRHNEPETIIGLAPIINCQLPDKDWIDYLYHNTFYAGAKLPISHYTVKKKPLFANTRIAILAITFLMFIPLLAAFAGEGALYKTDSSLTGLAGANAEGILYKATAASPFQGVGCGEGASNSICSGFLPGNRRPTQETPVLNSTDAGNTTLGNLNCYNQSTADEDGDKITNEYQWYNSWGTPAITIIENTWENLTAIVADSIAHGHTYTCQITPNDGQEDGNPLNSTSLYINQYTPPPEPESGGARGTEGTGAGGSYSGVMAQPAECIIDEDCEKDEKCIDNKCAKLFDIQMIRVDSPIESTDILDFTFLMKAMGEIEGDVTLEYWIQKPGTDEKLIRGQDVVYMKPYQTKITDASLYLYKSMLGEYELAIKITYMGYTVETIRPIEIVEKAPTTLTTNLLEFNPPKFTLQIGTNKDREIEVSLVETITKNNKIVWQNKKQASVQRTLTLEEQMTGLKAGAYELKITADAEGKTSELTRTFTLEEEIMPITEQPKQMGQLKNMLLIFLYSIGALGILIVMFYAGRTIARHSIAKEGRQEIRNELRGMQKNIQKWRKKGFDTKKITGMLELFNIKNVGFRELKGAVSRTGTKTIQQIKKAGESGKKTAEALGTNTLEQAKELSRRTISRIKKTGDMGAGVLTSARGATSQILQAGEKTIGKMEAGLLSRIKYWKERGADTGILERKLRKITMPNPPEPASKKAMPEAPKPAYPKPAIKPAGPAEKPEATRLKPIEYYAKPAENLRITPGIISKPIKPVSSAQPLMIRELEHKLQKWKAHGFDTRILERKLKQAQKRNLKEIKPFKKETLAEKLRNRLKEKIKKWKAGGYDTTILEQKLKEAETGKIKIRKYHPENRLLSRIAEWKAEGYNTAILEKQLTPEEGLKLTTEALEDKIKLWKQKGYNTTILEQKLKQLRKK